MTEKTKVKREKLCLSQKFFISLCWLLYHTKPLSMFWIARPFTAIIYQSPLVELRDGLAAGGLSHRGISGYIEHLKWCDFSHAKSTNITCNLLHFAHAYLTDGGLANAKHGKVTRTVPLYPTLSSIPGIVLQIVAPTTFVRSRSS